MLLTERGGGAPRPRYTCVPAARGRKGAGGRRALYCGTPIGVPLSSHGTPRRYPAANSQRSAQPAVSFVRHDSLRCRPAAGEAPCCDPDLGRHHPPRRQTFPVRLWGGPLHPSRNPDGDLLISHVSINFDRNGWQRDVNVVYPIDRLRELAAAGEIAAVAPTHYTVMGSTDPAAMGDAVDQIVGQLKQERIDSVLLTPV